LPVNIQSLAVNVRGGGPYAFARAADALLQVQVGLDSLDQRIKNLTTGFRDTLTGESDLLVKASSIVGIISPANLPLIPGDKLVLGQTDNLCEDSSFEEGQGSWMPRPNYTAGIHISSANPRNGNLSMRRIADGVNDVARLDSIRYVDVRPGDKFYLEAWGDGTIDVDGTAVVAIRWYDKDKVFISPSSAILNPTVTYTKFSATATAPADAVYARITVGTDSHLTGTWYIDDVYWKRQIETDFLADGAVTDAKVANLSAGKINTGTLIVGGSGTNANLSIRNGSDIEIGWAGKSGSDYGIWGQQLRAGGTNFGNAPFRASSSGLEIDNAVITLEDVGTGNYILLDPISLSIKVHDWVNDASLTLVNSALNAIHIKSSDANPTGPVESELTMAMWPSTKLTFWFEGNEQIEIGGSGGGFFPHIVVYDTSGQGRVALYDGDGSGQNLDVLDAAGNIKVSLRSADLSSTVLWLDGFADFNNVSSSTATSGGTGFLPAAIEGYISVLVDGTERKIAYYRV
jgi:hypothetical protein